MVDGKGSRTVFHSFSLVLVFSRNPFKTDILYLVKRTKENSSSVCLFMRSRLTRCRVGVEYPQHMAATNLCEETCSELVPLCWLHSSIQPSRLPVSVSTNASNHRRELSLSLSISHFSNSFFVAYLLSFDDPRKTTWSTSKRFR